MRVVYLFVEGNTDKMLIEALLCKRFGYSEYKNVRKMPLLLSRQVGSYPKPDGNIEKKGTPSYIFKDNTGIMIEPAGGKDKFGEKIAGRLKAVSLESFSEEDSLVIAVIQDRDLESCTTKQNELKKNLQNKKIIWDGNTISYDEETYDFLEYCIPHNREGAVEKIVLELAGRIYPELTFEAEQYRKRTGSNEKIVSGLGRELKTENNQFKYPDKVQVGAITAVLKPDSSPGMMVKDILLKDFGEIEICESEEIKGLLDFLELL